MKNIKSMIKLVVAFAIGVLTTFFICRKNNKEYVWQLYDRETSRIIGALLKLTDQHYSYWGKYPELNDMRCELVASSDESTQSYLDAYEKPMKISESDDKIIMRSAGLDGMFDTADDIVGVAIRMGGDTRVSIVGPHLYLSDDMSASVCEGGETAKEPDKCEKFVLRSVIAGETCRGFWVENLGEDICLKIPDMGIEYCIDYETGEGVKKTFRNECSPTDTFKLVPLDGKSRNPDGNTSYYFETNMPKDCVVPISARVKIYVIGFESLKAISDTESLRKHLIDNPIELTVSL